MKVIQVNSLPLYEVIQDIARALDVSYEHNCGIYTLNLPSSIGEGSILGLQFEEGLGVIQYDCTFYENIEIHFSISEVHPLKFIYCLEGTITHRFENEKRSRQIDQYQSVVVASSSHNGHVLTFKKDAHTMLNSLELDRTAFLSQIECELDYMDARFKRLFQDIEAKEEFYHTGNYSLQIADLFRQRKEEDQSQLVRKIYLKGQAYKILAAEILQLEDDVMDSGQQSLLRQSELQSIEEATEIIRANLEDLKNIDAISRTVGLNMNKLQAGFQYMYQTSVNKFIQQTRMERAKELLIDPEYNITQVVDEIGLSSNSYFSKLFKEIYNMTPSEYKKKHQEYSRDS